jgi:hypothetical protein
MEKLAADVKADNPTCYLWVYPPLKQWADNQKLPEPG